MPIIKSAIKKLRQDRKREKTNDAKRTAYKRAIKKAQKSKKVEDIKKAVSLIDKAVKKHLLHANKAARLKGQLAKFVGSKAAKKPAEVKPAVKPAKPAAKAPAKVASKPTAKKKAKK